MGKWVQKNVEITESIDYTNDISTLLLDLISESVKVSNFSGRQLHLVLTMPSFLNRQDLRLYLNGIRVDLSKSTSSFKNALVRRTLNLLVGTSIVRAIRIYNKALSQFEIMNNFYNFNDNS